METLDDVCMECGQIVGMNLDPVAKLDRGLKEVAGRQGRRGAGRVVDVYYRQQEHRLALGNQIRTLDQSEPTEILDHLYNQVATLEKVAAVALGEWSMSYEVGRWSRRQIGIGPVLAAGLIAFLDIEKAPTVGHIWRYGGYDPTLEWLGTRKATELVDRIVPDGVPPNETHLAMIGEELHRKPENLYALAMRSRPGREEDEEEHDLVLTRAKLVAALARRPYNARVKTMFWNIGKSFVRTSGRDNSFYGKLYVDRKAREVTRNEAGDYAELAAQTLEERNIVNRKLRETYEAGRLPAGRIDLRAMRWAVKLFLAHWHGVAFEERYGTEPPLPYPVVHLGHGHVIERPA